MNDELLISIDGLELEARALVAALDAFRGPADVPSADGLREALARVVAARAQRIPGMRALEHLVQLIIEEHGRGQKPLTLDRVLVPSVSKALSWALTDGKSALIVSDDLLHFAALPETPKRDHAHESFNRLLENRLLEQEFKASPWWRVDMKRVADWQRRAPRTPGGVRVGTLNGVTVDVDRFHIFDLMPQSQNCESISVATASPQLFGVRAPGWCAIAGAYVLDVPMQLPELL